MSETDYALPQRFRQVLHPDIRIYKKPSLPVPSEWKTFDTFNWNRKIYVDVGCGSGDWVMSEGERNPHAHYIGIEKTKNRSERALQKTQHSSPSSNVTIVRADAIFLLANCFPEESISGLTFFHPNPWPKRKQANKRYFTASSFSVFHRVLAKNGTLYLVSNMKAYREEARFFLEKQWGYRITMAGNRDASLAPRTLFERKYQERSHQLYELMAEKITSSAPAR